MINKNVCPNCGQLYDTDLEKCPLCGTAAQVVEVDAPVQRKRITEAERRQRRVDRREAEQEARLRKKNDKIMQDAEEERLLKEASERRKEEKRLKKEAKRAAKQGREESGSAVPLSQAAVSPAVSGSPEPGRMTRRPTIEEQYVRDNSRVPRFFLVLSFLLLLATLVIGGSYLLWKTGKMKLPIYDKLFQEHHQTVEAADGDTDPAASTVGTEPEESYTGDPTAEEQPCQSLKLTESEIILDHANQNKQIGLETVPTSTTDAKVFVSSDEGVVKVSAAGVLTSVAPGTATVTVTCGSQSAVCTVVCDFEADPNASAPAVDVDQLILNYPDNDMTFFNPGESTTLTITNIPSGTHVDWSSQDESIATIDENGRVTAVGNGTTKVVGKVGSKTVECWVRCHFPEEENP